ncbi:MAG TPA: GNAT family protein [Anaerolineae bacterium]|nr:GNAT family protein [Anaerolineae bacterium]HQI85575.1 GNAT family protein [Anaerolineae bacterium]
MTTEPFFAPEHYVTEEFTIRSYVPGDGPLLAEAVNASYEHLKRFMVWAKPHTEEIEAEQTVRRFRGEYLLSTNFVLGIFSPDGKRLLGGSGFHLREGELSNRAAEIGMWIRADAAHKGLGPRVLRAILTWGFTEWPWERLTWRCNEENIASRRTAERAGMQFEGRFRAVTRLPDGTRETTLLFAALKGEWGQLKTG